jgi:hypothetical protein
MSRIVPEAWLPECAMKRIITHWTAGAYHASAVDREHYHIIIEGDGKLVRGDRSIRDNVSTADDTYAAHTRGCNTGSIGVACAAMQGAIQQPFFAGDYPLTREQYDALALVAADLCEFYAIPVEPTTVLNHGEVEATLHIPQHQKWDICVLPWNPSMVAGAFMRNQIKGALHGEPIGAAGAPITVEIDGKVVSDEAFLSKGDCFVPLRAVAEARGWMIADICRGWSCVTATVMLRHDQSRDLTLALRGDRAYARARNVAAMAGWPAPDYIAATRQLIFLTYGKEAC